MKLGAKIFGALSGLFLLFLLVGLLLPGRWSARVEAILPAPPDVVFSFLAGAERWTRWTPVPPAGVTLFGPTEGPGSGFRWDDPGFGRGELEILDVDPPHRLTYRVEMEDGALQVRGELELTLQGEDTRILWKEDGDFGMNPLLGYTARSMSSSQSAAMRSSLERLRALLTPEELSEPDVALNDP